MSWYGPGPARPAMPPMGFGQGPPMSNMVPWGPPGGMPPGGMPPRPQFTPAPQPHFEQRPKRVRLIFQCLHLCSPFKAIPTGPAVTVFVGNITERAPDSMAIANLFFGAVLNSFSPGSPFVNNSWPSGELEESPGCYWKTSGVWRSLFESF